MENDQKKLNSLKKDWDDLAKIDPLWAIASDDTKSHGKWDPDEFFETGRNRVQKFFDVLNASGLTLNPGTALDFGCGIGRLTQALAEKVDICYGIDISREMIDLASKNNRYGDRCKYILNERDDLKVFNSNFFDLVSSDIVLQHMPPELMKSYLVEFIRVLKPSGILLFQVPVAFSSQDLKKIKLKSLPKFHPMRLQNKLKGLLIGHNVSDRYDRLRKIGLPQKWLYEKFGLRPKIEMYQLTESEIRELMADVGAQVVSVEYETEADVISGLFVVKKV